MRKFGTGQSNFNNNNSPLISKAGDTSHDSDSQWQKWLKKGNESESSEHRKMVAMKKIRSIRFLEHI